MALCIDDKWIWDLWLALDSLDYHAFYLQASKALGDPELRHRNVSVGHAVSQDLRSWEILPDALHPSSEEGAWDDFTTWTGSVIQHEGRWYMFYTGGNRAENALIQRIGYAVSKDLIHWERFPGNPVILHDEQHYEGYDPDLWHDHTWRDPWVMKDPNTGSFFAFITARVKDGPKDGRGVIALAHSQDLVRWEVRDPVMPPGDFGYMEVPQVINIEGIYYLLFSTVKQFHSEEHLSRSQTEPQTGLHYLIAEDLTGPYQYLTDTFLLGDSAGTHYGGKIVKDPDGHWALLPMCYLDGDGNFVGEMGDPVPVKVDSLSALNVDVNNA
jgi:beta-fructofuranosidase